MTPWLNHLKLLSLEAVLWVTAVLTADPLVARALGRSEGLYLSLVLLMTVGVVLVRPRTFVQTLDVHLGCVALALLTLLVSF